MTSEKLPNLQGGWFLSDNKTHVEEDIIEPKRTDGCRNVAEAVKRSQSVRPYRSFMETVMMSVTVPLCTSTAGGREGCRSVYEVSKEFNCDLNKKLERVAT